MPRLALIQCTVSLLSLLFEPRSNMYPGFTAYAQAADAIDWQDGALFSAQDRSEILSLTKKMGIENPMRVSHGQYLPSFGDYVMVESVRSETGFLRTWLELVIYRKDWMNHYKAPYGSKTKRVGRWIAYSSNLARMNEWKIEDGQWQMYIRFEGDVPHQDAESVIRAIRHGQLVNCLPKTIGSIKLTRDEHPVIDLADVEFIRGHGNDPRTYDLQTGKSAARGQIFTIKINNDRVELHLIRTWRA